MESESQRGRRARGEATGQEQVHGTGEKQLGSRKSDVNQQLACPLGGNGL